MPTQPKVALVTGASSGIGAATARRLAREAGTELVLVARRGEVLADLAASLACPATWIAVDLTRAEAPERVRAHVEQHHDRLDLLVNVAGTAGRVSRSCGKPSVGTKPPRPPRPRRRRAYVHPVHASTLESAACQ